MMDVFPTFLKAAGGDLSQYQLDGLDLLPMVADKSPSPHGPIFWEMGKQTAMRQGQWKLVLNGQLVEGAPVEDEVFLADLKADPGERTNLRNAFPDVTQQMKTAAEAWRAGIEKHWEENFAEASKNTTSLPPKK